MERFLLLAIKLAEKKEHLCSILVISQVFVVFFEGVLLLRKWDSFAAHCYSITWFEILK